MINYTPNFNDPRVRRRLTSALSWATQMLDEHKAKGWSTRHIDKRIGYSYDNIGKFARSTLLIEDSPYYSKDRGQAKQYRLNLKGVYSLSKVLGIDSGPRTSKKKIGLQLAREHWRPVFEKETFEYEDKGNRYYNELQNIRSDIRAPLFASYGYVFNYDIQNAYPTLVLQYVKQNCNLRKPLTALEQYVQNSDLVRNQLAQRLGVDPKTAKKLIIAKFNGASLSPRGHFAQSLTRLQFHKLKRDPWFSQLCSDIQRAWQRIAQTQQKRTWRSHTRMQFYLELERSVMSVIRREFSKKNIPIFLEHDGWRSKDYIDPYLLGLRVRTQTGFSVNFTCEVKKWL